MLLSRGDLGVFVDVQNHPIATVFVGLAALLIVLQIVLSWRRWKVGFKVPAVPPTPSGAEG
jgi:hypothetical protein